MPQTARTKAMNFRHRRFLKLYLGSHPALRGNATQCYKTVYGVTADRTAQVCGSRLLQLPHVKAVIEAAEAKAVEQLSIDAQFVLAQNVRLFNRAMGDDSYDHVTVDTDPDTGAELVSVVERRSYDPATAHKALQSIGQHKDVQAFTQVVEHNHTHVLEQRLAARSKVIEGMAQVVSDEQLPDLTDTARTEPGEVGVSSEVGAHAAKRVHHAEVNDDPAGTQEKTSSERAGATA